MPRHRPIPKPGAGTRGATSPQTQESVTTRPRCASTWGRSTCLAPIELPRAPASTAYWGIRLLSFSARCPSLCLFRFRSSVTSVAAGDVSYATNVVNVLQVSAKRDLVGELLSAFQNYRISRTWLLIVHVEDLVFRRFTLDLVRP